MQTNYYYIDEQPSKGLLIMYVTSCGARMQVGHITPEERYNINPMIAWDIPGIGINGIYKLAELLKGFQVAQKN